MKINIQSPDELRGMSPAELNQLASDIRQFLIEKVSRTGGHLGPNLGVVELTIAVHRVFQSPRDVVLFDTGHQSYVHKILTGRADQFDLLRQRDGISGYPNRRESEHDVIENSHASTALSWADGVSRGFSLTGQSQRHVVAVVGDGALTGGMAWEALNNITDDNTVQGGSSNPGDVAQSLADPSNFSPAIPITANDSPCPLPGLPEPDAQSVARSIGRGARVAAARSERRYRGN